MGKPGLHRGMPTASPLPARRAPQVPGGAPGFVRHGAHNPPRGSPVTRQGPAARAKPTSNVTYGRASFRAAK